MAVCVECENVLTHERKRVSCAAQCGRIWHVECSGLSKNGIHAMSENSALVYVCFECRRKMRKEESPGRDTVTKSVLNEECFHQMEHKCKEMICAEIGLMTEKIMTTLNRSVAEKVESEIEKLKSSLQNSNSRNAVGMRDWSKVVQGVSPAVMEGSVTPRLELVRSDSVSSKESGTLRNGKRRRGITGHNVEQRSDSINRTRSRNQINENGMSEMISAEGLNGTVCFKPIKSQDVEVTRKDIKTNFDPVKMKVKSVRFVNETAEAFVRCQSVDSADALLKSALKSIGKKYEIYIKRPNRPKLRIVGFEAEDAEHEETFIRNLKTQNGLPENADITIKKLTKNDRWKFKPMVAIIEADAGSFEHLIKRGKVIIGWERCKIFEEVGVLRCFKCQAFGHKFDQCQGVLCCPRCAECHEFKDCESDYEKCGNCDRFNITNKCDEDSQLDVCHCAWSYECEVYKLKQSNAKRNIDYSK